MYSSLRKALGGKALFGKAFLAKMKERLVLDQSTEWEVPITIPFPFDFENIFLFKVERKGPKKRKYRGKDDLTYQGWDLSSRSTCQRLRCRIDRSP